MYVHQFVCTHKSKPRYIWSWYLMTALVLLYQRYGVYTTTAAVPLYNIVYVAYRCIVAAVFAHR